MSLNVYNKDLVPLDLTKKVSYITGVIRNEKNKSQHILYFNSATKVLEKKEFYKKNENDVYVKINERKWVRDIDNKVLYYHKTEFLPEKETTSKESKKALALNCKAFFAKVLSKVKQVQHSKKIHFKHSSLLKNKFFKSSKQNNYGNFTQIA